MGQHLFLGQHMAKVRQLCAETGPQPCSDQRGIFFSAGTGYSKDEYGRKDRVWEVQNFYGGIAMYMLTLKYVVTVADLGSYSKAAEKLFVSQPALSQAIRRLETELQAQMFQKQNGRSVPTLAGEIVVEKGRRILELHQELLSDISNINELRAGTLNIGVAPFYHKVYLSRCLSDFHARYPKVEVAVQEGFTQSTISGILAGELDLGLVSSPFPDTVEECALAFEEEVLLAVPPGFAINGQYCPERGVYPEVDLKDFRDMNFVSYRPGRNMTLITKEQCRRAGFAPNIVFRCGSTESVNAMIASGTGVGFVPGSIAEICPASQQAVYYRLSGGKIMRKFFFIHKKNKRLNPAQKRFLELAQELAHHM